MQENTSQQAKPTPPRRRNGRHPGKASGQKMYASENDASGPSAIAFSQPSQPFTPHKSTSASPDPHSATANPSASRSARSRNAGNKSRGKNTAASPTGRKTTPPNSLPSTRFTSSTAFAGSTFHASPAPSALPIPSFYSKNTTTDSPCPPSSKRPIQQQPSPPATDSEAPTPSHSFVPTHDSPLEAMFRADRSEKERARRANFANANLAATRQTLLSPQSLGSGPSEPRTMPHRQENTFVAGRFQVQRSTSGIPLSELDGTPVGHVGPAFATPYHERIRAAHGSPHSPLDPRYAQAEPREDPSEALKRVLFGPRTEATRPLNASPSARLPADTPPSAPGVAAGRPNGVAEMEDSLRRILKLS